MNHLPDPAELRRAGSYVVSLPERLARAAAALAGGTLKETADVALPDVIRDSRLYQSTIGRMLRIVVEAVGDVSGQYPHEAMSAGELMKRKAAGNVLEVASIVATGLSPIWVLAAVADITGGTKTYLRELVAELRADGRIAEDAEVSSFEELLTRLETGTGVIADSVDIPPTSVEEARRSWELLRRQGRDLPTAAELGELWSELRRTARREHVPLSALSASIGAAAARAGIGLGNVHLFQFYKESIDEIRERGLLPYLRDAAGPYARRAAGHFRPEESTFTERFFTRLGKSRRHQ